MLLFPAIDLIGGEAVRLYQGDYEKKTVYDSDPVRTALGFAACGSRHLHVVDLDGAKEGGTPNLETVLRIKKESGMFVEIGGGIRSMKTVETYLSAGVDRVIIGTAAVTDEAFLKEALKAYGGHIAVGADFRGGFVAVKGWTETTALSDLDFCRKMQDLGVRTLICTDISKDGAMQGTNTELYQRLSGALSVQITASGGVSSLEDIRRLKALGIYGAIIGKGLYTGAVGLKAAEEAAV